MHNPNRKKREKKVVLALLMAFGLISHFCITAVIAATCTGVTLDDIQKYIGDTLEDGKIYVQTSKGVEVIEVFDNQQLYVIGANGQMIPIIMADKTVEKSNVIVEPTVETTTMQAIVEPRVETTTTQIIVEHTVAPATESELPMQYDEAQKYIQNFNMDTEISKPSGISKNDFKRYCSNMKYDKVGFFNRNAEYIWQKCQEYNFNEFAFIGIMAAESGWGSQWIRFQLLWIY